MRQNVKKEGLHITLNVSQKNDATRCKDWVEGKGVVRVGEVGDRGDKRKDKRTFLSFLVPQQTLVKGQHSS